ncbi:MAG TPA: SDR family NAD(P)-dependent oxidoreductase [Acidimicrobiales bacterium]|nr:SDR family NAD(P)-dependent oxidoreductase [Acidimicrobiales bacterium]
MGDMDGKTVLVTGGNTGIGKETAVQLAQKGATVAITSRDAAKGAAAAKDIATRAGTDAVEVFSLDLGSFASIRQCAVDVQARLARLDVLVNNAGAMLSDQRTTTEGFEMTLGANHLGTFLLTSLLIDRVRAAGNGRVVTVASIAHRGTSEITEADFFPGDKYRGMTAYSKSKFANILFARELARREKETGSDVSSFAVHPGGVRSEFGLGGDGSSLLQAGIRVISLTPFYISPRAGAGPSVYCASQPGLESQTGAYLQRSAFGNWGPVGISKPNDAAQDDTKAAALWDLSEKLIANAPG